MAASNRIFISGQRKKRRADIAMYDSKPLFDTA
jgi:hypothetical protein